MEVTLGNDSYSKEVIVDMVIKSATAYLGSLFCNNKDATIAWYV